MNSSPGNGMMIVIVVVVLLVLCVGVYFAYKAFFNPAAKCNNKDSDSTSHISTFVWDSKSSTCLANVCMDGFGDAATGGKPVSGNCYTFTGKTYSAVAQSGKCSVTGSATGAVTGVSNLKSQTDCESACNNSKTSCAGYDWDGKSVCNLYATPTPNAGDGTSGFTCYAAADSK